MTAPELPSALLYRRLQSVADRAKTWAAAPVKMTQAICEPESDMSRRRLDICRACDKWNGSTCSICGCFTALKVRLKAEACPIGKWPAEE
jgi:hypothetical protein